MKDGHEVTYSDCMMAAAEITYEHLFYAGFTAF